MCYIFLFLLFLFVIFTILSIKYKNPYKLIFIFGKKGAGKSCFMVNQLLKYKKRGWICYTDMPVSIPGVRIISANDLKNHFPDEKSALFLDEVGLTWDNRGFKTFDKGFTEFFKLQRKCKCVVYMNSQSFDIDKKIRDVTDSMILQSNIGNVISVSRPILRKVRLVEATGDSESRIADNLKFDSIFRWKLYYMPRYFKYFQSFAKPERPSLPFSLSEDLYNLTEQKPVRALKLLRKRKPKAEPIIKEEQSPALPQCVNEDFSFIEYVSIN